MLVNSRDTQVLWQAPGGRLPDAETDGLVRALTLLPRRFCVIVTVMLLVAPSAGYNATFCDMSALCRQGGGLPKTESYEGERSAPGRLSASVVACRASCARLVVSFPCLPVPCDSRLHTPPHLPSPRLCPRRTTATPLPWWVVAVRLLHQRLECALSPPVPRRVSMARKTQARRICSRCAICTAGDRGLAC